MTVAEHQARRAGGPPRRQKASSAAQCQALLQVPNIGPAMVADLKSLGITAPGALARADAFSLYQALCRQTGQRQDPCVLDTFIAAIDFMRGAPARPWCHYTAQRKRDFPSI